MAELAMLDDVESSLGRSLSAEETPRAEKLIRLASAHVEDVTRTRLAPGTYTVGRRVRSGKVRVPGDAATVDAVREIDQQDGTATSLTLTTDYTVRGRTIYGLFGREYVEIDFTISAPIPDDIIDVVSGIVAATISGPPIGVSAESAGTLSVSYVNSSGKVWLSASDKAILNRYTTPRLALNLI